MTMIQRRNLGCTMNKFIVLLSLSVANAFGCFCEDISRHHLLKDTVIDCTKINVTYMDPYDYCCKGLKVGFFSPGRRDCKGLGRIDSVLPIHYDSIRTVEFNDREEKYSYLNNKIQKKEISLKDGINQTKEILVLDTTMQDTFFRIYLWSKYVSDSLVDRIPKIDTILIKK